MTTNFSSHAERSLQLRPTLYRLVGGIGLVYLLVFLLAPLLTSNAMRAPSPTSEAVLSQQLEQVMIGVVFAFVALFLAGRALSCATAGAIGLMLFVVAWPPETLRWGIRGFALLPFCCYFLFRAERNLSLNAIALSVISIPAIYFALVNKHVLFPGVPAVVLQMMLWVWMSFVGVCIVNLAMAFWAETHPANPQQGMTEIFATAPIPEVAVLVPAPVPITAPCTQPTAGHAGTTADIRGVALTPVQPSYTHSATYSLCDLDDVVGMHEVKARLIEAGVEALKATDSKSNGILLYGPPGNGKTYLAQALAGTLRVPIINSNFGLLVSMFVNETTEKSVQVFRDAAAQAPCILFIDEVEALLGDRRQQNTGAGEYPKTVSALLAQLVDVRKLGVIVMAATNHLDMIDSAASREGRFDTKIEIPPPDAAARRHLITESFAKSSDNRVSLDEAVVESLTNHWDGFSVSRISAVTGLLGRRVKNADTPRSPSIEDFQRALRETQGSHGDIVMRNVIGLEELHYDGGVAQHLVELAESMRNTFVFEQLGGRVAGGVLFYGPPGTGKTIAASALAKSAGWAMICTNGTDLARDPDKIRNVISRAVDLKPCIVFIDEADALISDRSQNWNSMATNAFLSQTGDDRAALRDVMFIAATNHPEGADSAMVRGGRFGLHIEFTLPEQATILKFLRAQAAKSPASSADPLLVEVSGRMVGMPLSDVRGALLKAWNRAASRAMKATSGGNAERKSVLKLEDFPI